MICKEHNIKIESHPSGPVYYEGNRENIWNYFKEGQPSDYIPPTLFKVDANELKTYDLDLDPDNTYKISSI